VTDLEPHEPTAVDPRSGEVIDLANAPHGDLVEAFLILQDHERRAKEWRTAVEDELVRRHEAHDYSREPQTIGEYIIEIDKGRVRHWDVDDVEAVVSDLIQRRLLDPQEAAGLIKEHRSVDGNIAKRLLDGADSDVLFELSRCFSWQQRGRARVKVTAPQQLTE
jgi:hypothetical protein